MAKNVEGNSEEANAAYWQHRESVRRELMSRGLNMAATVVDKARMFSSSSGMLMEKLQEVETEARFLGLEVPTPGQFLAIAAGRPMKAMTRERLDMVNRLNHIQEGKLFTYEGMSRGFDPDRWAHPPLMIRRAIRAHERLSRIAERRLNVRMSETVGR